ncbi:hypothetical protein B0H13DRAFT_2280303 [Mycena leptocephala]|nr:hypothetical protein B0H13DRAFT_2280303 [Mycena leptocephala]
MHRIAAKRTKRSPALRPLWQHVSHLQSCVCCLLATLELVRSAYTQPTSPPLPPAKQEERSETNDVGGSGFPSTAVESTCMFNVETHRLDKTVRNAAHTHTTTSSRPEIVDGILNGFSLLSQSVAGPRAAIEVLQPKFLLFTFLSDQFFSKPSICSCRLRRTFGHISLDLAVRNVKTEHNKNTTTNDRDYNIAVTGNFNVKQFVERANTTLERLDGAILDAGTNNISPHLTITSSEDTTRGRSANGTAPASTPALHLIPLFPFSAYTSTSRGRNREAHPRLRDRNRRRRLRRDRLGGPDRRWVPPRPRWRHPPPIPSHPVPSRPALANSKHKGKKAETQPVRRTAPRASNPKPKPTPRSLPRNRIAPQKEKKIGKKSDARTPK